ncbi:P-loop containing nucleoside triphosphate hydrolase protein, partial [Ascoidea rubescens DSM 1968]
EDDLELKKFEQFFMDLSSKNSSIMIHPDGLKLLLKDFNRLFRMSKSSQLRNSSDYNTLLGYLETIVDLPWSLENDVPTVDLNKAQIQLDADHYGLKNVKKRLIEYLANKLSSKSNLSVSRAPIICLYGPPGVGKTSLAKSVAKTMGRQFQRISLGGINHESEIRGHRRTYVGALPGVLVSALRKSKSLNPVILLDEIDKVQSGGKGGSLNGDPSAALLEVLDPEQNSTFTDHFIGFPIDLSQVLFICTANDISRLHPALMDRMEVIEITGYNQFDKIKIAKKHLLPKQLLKNGLPKNALKVDDDTIMKLILDFTHPEAGVRNLERQISAICRGKAIEYSKFVKNDAILEDISQSDYSPLVSENELFKYLGLPPLNSSSSIKNNLTYSKISTRYGVVNGLSYNSNGSGSTLLFETISVPADSYSLITTGKLGSVLSESVKIGVSLVKFILSRNLLSGVNIDCEAALEKLSSSQIHLHVPEGAVSKDGPSAGITITLSLLSLLLEIPVDPIFAMTGEITLRGLVLPIGGVREKLLGAHLSGKVTKVLLPRANRKDIIQEYLDNIDSNYTINTDNTVVQKQKDMQDKLISIIKQEQENIHNVDIFEEPEKYIKEKLGIEVHYVEEFWDVIKAVWSNDIIADTIPISYKTMESHL